MGVNQMTIKEMRTATGLTQKAFAELLGMPKRTVENWEGDVNKCPEYLLRLIEYYLKNENLMDNERF